MNKPRKYKHICKHCNNEYLGADVKGNCCYSCKEKIICVNCGKRSAYGWSMYREINPGCCSRCYQKLNKGKNRKELLGPDYVCPTKGKTYKEIYGTDNPTCGYKNGKDNIACKDDIKQKISEGVTKSYTPELRKLRGEQTKKNLLNGMHFGVLKQENSIGQKFRSKLEVSFSETLLENNIKYKFEGKTNRIRLNDGSVKVVDFIVGELIIEVSGFAYKKWQDDFIEKIEKLYETTDKKILILTYPSKVSLIKKRLKGKNIFIESVENTEKYLKIIKKEG